MRRRPHRPSPAILVAVIALVLAMTGVGWAVSRNSVGTKQIKKGAVTAPKLHRNSVTSPTVRNNSLLAEDFKAGVLPGALPSAPTGTATSFRIAPDLPVTSTATLPSPLPATKTFLLSDVVFQNPASDMGRVRVQRAGQVLLEVGLQSFSTTVEQQFVTPLEFKPGEALTVFIDCDNPSGGCLPAVLFSGVLQG
jgi:hypothetical protein